MLSCWLSCLNFLVALRPSDFCIDCAVKASVSLSEGLACINGEDDYEEVMI